MLLGSLPITRTLPTSKARQKSGPFPPPALPGLSSTTALSDSRRGRRSWRRRGRYPRLQRVSPDYPRHPSSVLCPLPRQIERVLVSITSPFTRPSPRFGRVGIRVMDFEACSGFTRVTDRWIAGPPEAAFVTRLRPVRLPVQAARQLPDQSTTLWAEPSSAGDTRLRGAPKRTQLLLPLPDDLIPADRGQPPQCFQKHRANDRRRQAAFPLQCRAPWTESAWRLCSGLSRVKVS